jgi:hypothetical protein
VAGGENNISEEERKRIQEKQAGHHYGRPDGPPTDDGNTDEVSKPSKRSP